MNLMLMAYVQLDVLLVGFILGTTYTFFLLAHRVVTEDRVCMARFWLRYIDG
jgi:hypothetical protein